MSIVEYLNHPAQPWGTVGRVIMDDTMQSRMNPCKASWHPEGISGWLKFDDKGKFFGSVDDNPWVKAHQEDLAQ